MVHTNPRPAFLEGYPTLASRDSPNVNVDVVVVVVVDFDGDGDLAVNG